MPRVRAGVGLAELLHHGRRGLADGKVRRGWAAAAAQALVRPAHGPVEHPVADVARALRIARGRAEHEHVLRGLERGELVSQRGQETRWTAR